MGVVAGKVKVDAAYHYEIAEMRIREVELA